MKTMPKIVSNYAKKHFIYGYELPEYVKNDFDYIDIEELDITLFVKYKGLYYCLSEFVAFKEKNFWDCFASNTAFSGVVIKIINDDTYIIGSYFS